jgi:hypothetical protein
VWENKLGMISFLYDTDFGVFTTSIQKQQQQPSKGQRDYTPYQQTTFQQAEMAYNTSTYPQRRFCHNTKQCFYKHTIMQKGI